MARVKTKICGIRERASLDAAIAGGADYFGLVFFPPSPRSVTVREAAPLSEAAAGRIQRVGMFVDADDAAIETVLGEVALDLLQLHGDETPARVAAVRARFGLPVVKALPIAVAGDIEAAGAWRDAADILLFDAKPPARVGALPGGNARSFDWRLLDGRAPRGEWMLSGGLTPENVGRAIAAVRPPAIDVSSGVERRRGEKDPELIRAFLAAVRVAERTAAGTA